MYVRCPRRSLAPSPQLPSSPNGSIDHTHPSRRDCSNQGRLPTEESTKEMQECVMPQQVRKAPVLHSICKGRLDGCMVALKVALKRQGQGSTPKHLHEKLVANPHPLVRNTPILRIANRAQEPTTPFEVRVPTFMHSHTKKKFLLQVLSACRPLRTRRLRK